MPECYLCCDQKEIMTVGICEHPFVCLDCCYKCRVITKNTRCSHCNQDLEKVAAIDNPDSLFSSLVLTSQDEFKCGIYYTNPRTKFKCFSLESSDCPIPQCKKNFKDLKSLKKHLSSTHKRTFCEICLNNQALLLSEQKVYRFLDFEQHMQKGDFDEDNNIILFHPFCDFCQKSFFNEDAFTAHLKSEHVRCNLCDVNETKWIHYNNLVTLQIHQTKSHYGCHFPECIEKMTIAFKHKIDLEVHLNKGHYKTNTKQKVALSTEKQIEPKFSFKDKEGVNFSEQVI